MDKVKEKPKGSSAVREKGANIVRRGLESGADRLRTQLRDAAQRGQRDEYGGDQIEDAAARVPGRAARAAELRVRGGKRPDTGRPANKAWESVGHVGERGIQPGRAADQAAPRPEGSSPCTLIDNERPVPTLRQENWALGREFSRPAAKTKDAYIRQQVSTPVTYQPQGSVQGTAAFIQERGRQRSADAAGKCTVRRAGDGGTSPISSLESGKEAVRGASHARQPQAETAAVGSAGPSGAPGTWGGPSLATGRADSLADIPVPGGNVRRGPSPATGRAGRGSVASGERGEPPLPSQAPKTAVRPPDQRPGLIRTRGAGRAGKQVVKTLDRGQSTVGMAAQNAQTVQAARQARPARQAASAAKSGAKKAAQRAGSAVKGALATIRSVTALLAAGGGVVVAVVLLLCIVGLLLLSPFGLFFASQRQEPGAVPPNGAIAQLNADLAAYLAELQAGDYADIQLDGQLPDWREVLAVFAVRTTLGEDGVDVLTLDPDRVERLKEVFWDMTAITAETGETDTGTVLFLTVEAKTAEEMRELYGFTDEQSAALDELLAETELLDGLITDLSISQADAADLVEALPEDLDPMRRAVVENACSLVGKVNYWWGGKSLTLGWDDRWGSLRKVTADGSVTSGQYRPYGLDCSGMVDWVFYNATDGEYVIGHGGGATAQHSCCEPIAWEDALPGDLVFYPEDSHVGVVGGWDDDGQLLVIHCASRYNNTVITGLEGFTSIGRPVYYN